MSVHISECYPVECFGCGQSLPAIATDMYDGERYCAECLRIVEQQASECADSDERSYNHGRGV